MKISGAEASQQALKSTCPSRDRADAERAKRACQEFESILIYKMLSTMRRAFKTEDSDTGFGGDIFKSMMDEQLSVALARGGGMGLADLLGKGLGLGKEAVKEVIRLPQAPIRLIRRSIGEAEDARGSSKIDGIRSRLAPYEATIRAASKAFNLSANLIRAVIMQESAGNPDAVSNKGAKGLMQLADATARELGVTNPFDPVQNIFGGSRLLARLLRDFNGDLDLALASYNAGIGAVRRYGGVPPFEETQEYIGRVTRNLKMLGSIRDEAR